MGLLYYGFTNPEINLLWVGVIFVTQTTTDSCSSERTAGQRKEHSGAMERGGVPYSEQSTMERFKVLQGGRRAMERGEVLQGGRRTMDRILAVCMCL